jgi:hypothetical protein
MRRFFTIGAVVLIAAAFFGCAEQALEEDAPKYDAQGRRLVTFNVSTQAYTYDMAGSTRALTKPIAQAAWDYVEVIFKNGSEYYFRSAARGEDIRFSLPEMDGYTAVMLVGIANGTKLLGVGIPDGDVADGFGGIDITVGTTAIQFKVTALTADIGVPGTPGNLTLISNLAPSVSINKPEANVSIDGNSVPYFKLTEGTTDITGMFTIRGFPETNAVPKLVDVVGATTAITIGTPFNIAGAGKATMLGVEGTVAPTASINSGDLKINFNLAVSSDFAEGFSRLRLGASVKAFGAAGNGSVWTVSNGLENAYDLGVAPNSIGRDILFYVGMPTASDGGDNKAVVSDLDLTEKVPAPSVGAKPVMSFEGNQYIGTVIWNPSHETFASTSVRYTATVILWARENYTFTDPATGLVQFTHGGLDAPSGENGWSAGSISTLGNGAGVTVTITFPNSPPRTVEDLDPGNTGPDLSVDLDLTYYIPAPGVGDKLTMFFSPARETYTVKSITWNPLDNPAVGGVEYTAKVILTAKPGYTFENVQFTHNDAAEITQQDNGNETVTVTITFSKAMTIAYAYSSSTTVFSNAASQYTSVLDVIDVYKNYTYLYLTLSFVAPTNEPLITGEDFGSSGIVFTSGTGGNCPPYLIFDGGDRKFKIPAGTSITVGKGVTLTLKNITFKSNANTTVPLIKVVNGGTLILEANATISGDGKENTYSDGGLVFVDSGGTLVMKDGTISGGTATAGNGGGVFVANGGTFTMNGGDTSGNTAGVNGGGVYVADGGKFTMSGGTINGNTAVGNGGGVYVETSGTFSKTGGTIYGNTGTADANSAVNGKAVFVDSGSDKKRDTTAEPADKLDSTKDSTAGGWE